MEGLASVLFLLILATVACGRGGAHRTDHNLIHDPTSVDFAVAETDSVIFDKHPAKQGKLSNFRLKNMKIFQSLELQKTNKLTSVHEFGINDLCTKGRGWFYTALHKTLCNTSNRFINDLIDQLCIVKGTQLDVWVAELFDITGDGYVNHFEKHIYDKFY